jgi:anti-sigma factor RsiW
VSKHLESCRDCRHELERYQKLMQLLGRFQHAAAPDDLPTRIRIAVAKAREESGLPAMSRRLRDRAHLILANILQPLALPATGGLVVALLVFTLVLPFYARVGPLTPGPDDLPSALFQPARLETLAGFPVTLADSAANGPQTLLIEATVGVDGSIVDYRILSGPSDAAVRHQLDQVLLFSRFRPSMSFGRPMAGGRVVMSFSAVNVKG